MRDILAGAGLTEIVSYSLTSRTPWRGCWRAAPPPRFCWMRPFGGGADGAWHAGRARRGRTVERRQLEAIAERLPAIQLSNPPSSEQEVLRLTLMAGLLGALRENSKHEDEGLWLFELGRRYLPTEELRAGTGLARERRTLGIALTGPLAQSWIEGVRDADFYDLKGIVETLLEGLHVSGYRFVAAQHPTFHPGRSAALEVMPLRQRTWRGMRARARREPAGCRWPCWRGPS